MIVLQPQIQAFINPFSCLVSSSLEVWTCQIILGKSSLLLSIVFLFSKMETLYTSLSLSSHTKKHKPHNQILQEQHHTHEQLFTKCLFILTFAEFWAHKSPAYSSLGSYSIGGRFNGSFYLPVCFKRLITF